MRRARAVALVAVFSVCVGCFAERERLDAPRVTLTLDDTLVVPGGRLTGSMTAADASGIILLLVRAETEDSAFQQRADRIPRDSVEFEFSVHVSSAASPGDTVFVSGTAADDQGFDISVFDTAYVRDLP
jgi:hypothetical protein